MRRKRPRVRVSDPDSSFFYQSFFSAGVKLHIQYFVKNLLVAFDLPPCQVSANMYWIIVGLVKIFGSRGWVISPYQIISMYNLLSIANNPHEFL